jgi:HAD superfamily hydrolase (TIGR01549 family)
MKKIDLTKIKAVLFDRGNVIYDCKLGPPEIKQDEEAASLIQKYLKKQGVDVSFQAVLCDFICNWKDSFVQRDSRGYEIPVSEFFNKFAVRHQLSDSVVLNREMTELMSTAYHKWHRLEPGFISLLIYLKGVGIKTGIVSNAVFPDYVYISQLQKEDLLKYLDVCVFSSGAGILKPDKQILEIACSAINITPRECILVGDKILKDIACAQNAGAKSIWYNPKRKKNTESYLPDYVVRSLVEMKERIAI